MRKVIIADSATITRIVLERILDKADWKIFYVKYPRDLVTQVRDLQPDIIILEAEISGGKGKRIVEYLQKKPQMKHIPIILITRITDTEKYGMRSWPGVHSVLRKPLKSNQLLEAMQTAPISDEIDLDFRFHTEEVG